MCLPSVSIRFASGLAMTGWIHFGVGFIRCAVLARVLEHDLFMFVCGGSLCLGVKKLSSF